MAKPKFYLEKRKDRDGNPIVRDVPILMFYSFGSGRLQYYTGQRTDAKNYVEGYWSKGRDPIKLNAPNGTNINNALDLLATDVVDLHNKAKANGIVPTVEYFRKGLDAIHKPKPATDASATDFLEYLSTVFEGRKSGKRLVRHGRNKGRRYSPDGTKKLGSLISALKRYCSARKVKSIPFSSVNRKFYESFRDYMFGVEKCEVSTFATHVALTKTVMQEAKEDGLHDSDEHRSSHFVIPSYETDSIAVSPEYLERVEKLDLSLNPKLDNARDLFLVACYSALRFSDFSALTIEDVSLNFIRVVQAKTGDRVVIPVSRKMAAIIKKHGGGFPRAISNQKFNEYIKEVFEIAGLTHPVRVRNTRGGVEGFDEVPYNMLISSHTGRRTYATNMFKAGVPVMLIMAVTGHKTEASFLKYIRATNEDKARMMADMMEKLGL